MSTPFKPTQQQSEAVDPSHSVWVTANAGSGKTHVLVERVIRLLLDGAEPASILCITFTKAAAAEMSSRLYQRLSGWISNSDDELIGALEILGLHSPQPHHLLRARQLFTHVLETPGGLKIQTIHAFCERLLQLFPVEAGMAPGFRILDERQSLEMRQEAQSEILSAAKNGKNQVLAKAFAIVVANAGSETFDALIKNFLSASQNLRELLEGEIEPDDFSLVLKNALGLDLGEDHESLSQKLNRIDVTAYETHANILAQKNIYSGHDASGMMKRAIKQTDRAELLKQLYFTKSEKLSPRKALMHKETSVAHPDTKQFVVDEQQRLERLFNQLDILLRIDATVAIFTIAKAIHKKIDAKKRLLGTYDFDDLIKRTSALLHNSNAAQWVLYKLDSGLNHILLDEAQDTSPAQWHIIQALADEFFASVESFKSIERTIFVVGDRKQSIYSFQGADAESFARARNQFTTFIKRKGRLPAEIELNISYRSTEEILNAVNRVFPAALPERLGFSPEDMIEQDHTTNRSAAKGRVEVWPLTLPNEEEENPDHWLAPVDREPAQSSKRILSRQIARTIKSWIGQRKLDSVDRLIEPDDIMILLQSRGSLFSMLIAELRKIGVPVAGADRLKLHESLAILDLLAMAQWALLPDDDYALACILKSPFVPAPLTETQLFELAHNRGSSSLWARLQNAEDPNRAWLLELQSAVTQDTPYDFYTKILLRFRKPMLGRLGPEAGDATDAFLDQTLSYEIENAPSLTGFLHWFNTSETEIKRELEKNSGEVRLMTVHGAKGLEANIVILPDAASNPKGRDGNRLLMIGNNSNNIRLPLWNLSGLSVPAELQTWIDDAQRKAIAERRRLLYVAMTRARDELYFCGAKGKTKDISEQCWYALVEPILGITPHLAEAMVINDPQPPAKKAVPNIPPWVSQHVENEQSVESNSVSRLSVKADGANSKMRIEELQRGIAIHSLLQALPDIAPEHRESFATSQTKRFNLDLATALSLVKIVNLPSFEIFFGPKSEAEVEISGILQNGRALMGRIDRLVTNENEIILLDYKSDRFVPESVGIAHSYVRQIALYAYLVKLAFPQHQVKAALLWTQTCKLEWISAENLTRACEQEVA